LRRWTRFSGALRVDLVVLSLGIFANDNRDKVREENPGISFGQY
jgi:hypothetical protein